MATKSNKKRRMPIVLVSGKYYTRIRWGNDKTGRGEVIFPLGTNKMLVAEHRRDTIQDTSLRGKIIHAYEENGKDGVKRIKDKIDWYSKGCTVIELNITIVDIIKEYEEYLQSQRLKVNTIDIYMRTLYEFSSKIGIKQIGKIKQRHFTIFKNSMPNLSEHTVNRKLRALQTFFNWTLDDGYINNAIRIKKLPVVKPPVNFYSDAEFRFILKNVEKGFPHAQAKMIDDDRELFLDAYKLYWNTGMRLSEPFDNELKMDNDGYRLIITGTTTKNSYLRYVHLTEQQAITIIKMNKWLDHQLKSRKNRYETIKLFSRVFAKSLKKSNLMGKFHDLRKTFASKLWFLTGQEFALCYALGHTDTSMTKQYTSLDKVELARAFPDIAALKNGITSDKTPLRGYNQGDIELYSNFGFTYG